MQLPVVFIIILAVLLLIERLLSFIQADAHTKERIALCQLIKANNLEEYAALKPALEYDVNKDEPVEQPELPYEVNLKKESVDFARAQESFSKLLTTTVPEAEQ